MFNLIPNIHTTDLCKDYSMQELLPDFNEQEHALKFVLVQLALLGYVASVAYMYNKNNTRVTLSTIGFSCAAFWLLINSVVDAPLDGKELEALPWEHRLFLNSREHNPLERCRERALNAVNTPLPEEIFLTMFAVAALSTGASIGVSIYQRAQCFFSKNIQNSTPKLRQSQLEEFGIKVKPF